MSDVRLASTEASTGLIRMKMAIPRLHGALLPRAALLARLDDGLASKLTLIAAPAGFGKTTLVASWLATSHQPAGWVSLDAGDNEPLRFWRYVLAACRGVDARIGRTALAILNTSQQPAIDEVLAAFSNELDQLPGRVILVLEDYQAITSPEIHEAMATLLNLLPPTLHLVVITRSEPPLPLARLRARNDLSELSAADLRFTMEEATAFLQAALAVPLAPEAIARIEERTEGWAVGLRLAALALEGKSDPQESGRRLAAFTGEHRHVLAYLTGEVLAAQPAPIQAFLLRTSFLSRLTGSLCDAVMRSASVAGPALGTPAPDSAALASASLLEQIERANLFLVPLDGGDGQTWYRYHGLFAEAMRHAARQRLGEAAVQAIFAAASRWYEAHGLVHDAVEAAIAAGQHERAAALMEQLIEHSDFRELYTVSRWGEQLPDAVVRQHPLLSFGLATALLFTADRYAPATIAAIEPLLRVAEDAWRRERNDARLGEVLSVRASASLWQGDRPRSLALSKQALELLPEHEVMWRSVDLSNVAVEELRAGRIDAAQRLVLEAHALAQIAQNIHVILVTMQARGDIAYQQGDLDQAVQHNQEIMARAVGGEEMLDDQGLALAQLAAVAYERDDLDVAAEHAARALALARERRDEERQVFVGLLLARIEQVRGQPVQAQERLRALAARTNRPALLREIGAWQARLALAAGDVTAAELWESGLAAQQAEAWHMLAEREALIVARMRIAQGQPGAASACLAEWQADARANGRVRSEIEILSLKALACLASADQGQAEQALARSLALAQPGGFRRVFLDEGQLPMATLRGVTAHAAMSSLLQSVASTATRRPLAVFAGSLVRESGAAGSRPLPVVTSPLIEPLSAQEQRVLRLIVAGLSNPDIARQLVVSINTIKTQVRSIYRKLNVATREEARAVARELSLL